MLSDLHDCTSWGRYAVRIMVKLRAGIWAEKVSGELKPLYETAKKILRDEMLRTLGIDIHMDLKGRDAQGIFALKNHEKVLCLVPQDFQDDWCHFF